MSSHTVGNHSDDRGGSADYPCNCDSQPDTSDKLKQTLHRLIIENRNETGAIDQSDQSCMADEILELVTAHIDQAVLQAKIDELEEFKCYYPETATVQTKNLLRWHKNRITLLTSQLEQEQK